MPKTRRGGRRGREEAIEQALEDEADALPSAEEREEEEPAASDDDANDDDANEAPGEEEEPEAASTIQEWFAGAPLSRRAHLFFGFLMPAFVLVANMWRVRAFTIDDAYISFRYARNLGNGNGLVYNIGERIEGYTNFLFTVVLAAVIKVGLDPNATAKVIGGASALGALGMTYLLARRLRPFSTMPCVATWLLASTIAFSGWSVFGLETSTFVFLVLAGTELFFRETERAERNERGPFRDLPMSGLVFGLAGLTRPEAPMFIGLCVLFLGRKFFSTKNILRGALFIAPVALHMIWRKSYYGTWLPNTLNAKTGALSDQVNTGVGYIQNYAAQAGPVLWLALFGFAVAIAEKSRAALACATVGLGVLGYIVLIGGDWMPHFRFMASFEPFCFLLIDLGVRAAIDRRERAISIGFALFGIFVCVQRVEALEEAQKDILQKEDRFWKMATGGTAKWFLDHGERGEIAIGDIGYVGYMTDYPILDLLGLVDPVISKLPGGYTHKLGPGFLDRFFSSRSEYMLIISANIDCEHPSVTGSQAIYRDPRFRPAYAIAGKVPLDGGFAWCIYKRKD